MKNATPNNIRWSGAGEDRFDRVIYDAFYKGEVKHVIFPADMPPDEIREALAALEQGTAEVKEL